MKKIILFFGTVICLQATAQTGYKVVKTFHIQSPGGWDYIAVNNGKVYASHSAQVNVLAEETGDSLGVISNTNGVHGIAFDNELNRGYTSNGRSNNVTVFDLKTMQPVAQVATGEGPDAIMFEPHTQTIITCNGRTKNLSVIDPKTNTVLATIDVGGRPEEAASDGKGKLFVNLEDKSEIAVVDLKTHSVLNHWKLAPGEGPTGLAYDPTSNRLFAGCDKLLVVMNAADGNIVDKIKIGDGCDGVAFDAKRKLIFTSNGEGTLSVIKEVSANQFVHLGDYPTKRGARTIALDQANGNIFLPTADFDATQTNNGRPKMIPGTFQVLVVQASK